MRVTHSVIAAAEAAEIAGREYDLGDPLTGRLLSDTANSHYLLTAGEARYVLRIYRRGKSWVTKESDYRFELEWLAYLHEQGLPVAYPLPRRNGDLLGLLCAPEGERYYALFSFAPGRIVHSMDAGQSRLFGEGIARIHLASDRFQAKQTRFHQDTDELIDATLARIETFLEGRRPEDVAFFRALASSLKETLRGLPRSAPFYGIIGGDFHGGNHFFSSENRLTFFDFDMCGYGWRVYDLAVFFWSAKLRPEMRVTLADVLQGYEAVRPLLDVERAALPAMVKVRHLWIMGLHTAYSDQLGVGWLGDHYWERNVARLREWGEEEKKNGE
ncbi:MAG: phosphotransferase [Candidatus Manganitrophus sp. SA1]|nr:phosphotransferase [Candidatus Manganitrophus morganii]